MFSFSPFSMPSAIYVIGCGGTGSRLVPMLAQFLRSITRSYNPGGWLMEPKLILVDEDIVEEKNLLRQNFVATDVGKNKAAVLANRYGKHFGVNIVAVPEYVPVRNNFRPNGSFRAKAEVAQGTQEMVIMCVDSPDARRRILHHMAPSSPDNPTIFFDAGNEDNFGQVKMFSSHIAASSGDLKDRLNSLPPKLVEQVPVNFIPFDSKFYEEMVAGEAVGSCADLDQTLAINALMATGILGMVQNYFFQKPFTYNELRFDLANGNTQQVNTMQDFINKSADTEWRRTNTYSSRWYEGAEGGEGRYYGRVSMNDVFTNYRRVQQRSYDLYFPAVVEPVKEEVVEVALKSLAPKRKPASSASVFAHQDEIIQAALNAAPPAPEVATPRRRTANRTAGLTAAAAAETSSNSLGGGRIPNEIPLPMMALNDDDSAIDDGEHDDINSDF